MNDTLSKSIFANETIKKRTQQIHDYFLGRFMGTLKASNLGYFNSHKDFPFKRCFWFHENGGSLKSNDQFSFSVNDAIFQRAEERLLIEIKTKYVNDYDDFDDNFFQNDYLKYKKSIESQITDEEIYNHPHLIVYIYYLKSLKDDHDYNGYICTIEYGDQNYHGITRPLKIESFMMHLFKNTKMDSIKELIEHISKIKDPNFYFEPNDNETEALKRQEDKIKEQADQIQRLIDELNKIKNNDQT